jgi:hypothetical protein
MLRQRLHRAGGAVGGAQRGDRQDQQQTAAPAPTRRASDDQRVGEVDGDVADLDHVRPNSRSISELQFHIGGPPVVALAGMGRRLHLAQERVHLLGAHPAAGADGAVAGHAAEDRVDPGLQRGGRPRVVQLVEDVAQDRLGVDLAEDRRGFAHGDVPGPKGSMTRPSAASARPCASSRSASAAQVTISGISSAWRATPVSAIWRLSRS